MPHVFLLKHQWQGHSSPLTPPPVLLAAFECNMARHTEAQHVGAWAGYGATVSFTPPEKRKDIEMTSFNLESGHVSLAITFVLICLSLSFSSVVNQPHSWLAILGHITGSVFKPS